MKSVTRKTLKWIGRVLGLLGVCLAGFTAWYYIRATSIVGEWSEPKVQILGSMQSVNTDGSAALVDYFYDVSQIAQRKYPSTVWKGTGWERRITERVNRIAYGNELAVVDMATGEIIHHIFSSRGYRTSNDHKPLAMIEAGQNWVLVMPKGIYRVTPQGSSVLLAAGLNEKFLNVTRQRDADRAMVSSNSSGGEIRCLLLEASSGVITELYRIKLSARNATREIVYLSEDPSRTVVAVDYGRTARSGTLGLGIDPADGMPLQILSPESFAKGATRYDWALSSEKRQVRLYFPEEKSWLLDLDSLTTSPIEQPDASGWHTVEKTAASPLLRGYLTDHARTTFLHKPGRKNFHAP